MMELRPFRATDWTMLRRDTSVLSALAAIVREKAGMAFTAYEPVEDGERLLGCCGMIQHGKTGAVWAVFTDELKRDHRLWMHRLTKKYLWAVIETLELVRVEAVVDPNIPANIRWIEGLGFENKRIKEKGGESGEDVLEYVWLRPSVVGLRSEHGRESSTSPGNGRRPADFQLGPDSLYAGEAPLDSGL